MWNAIMQPRWLYSLSELSQKQINDQETSASISVGVAWIWLWAEVKIPFCCHWHFSGRSSNFKLSSFPLLFSSCHPTQQIRIMTAFQICGACTATYTAQGGTFYRGQWNVLSGEKNKNAIETSWPSEVIFCSALLDHSSHCWWEGQEFYVEGARICKDISSLLTTRQWLLPRLAAKSQCWQHNRGEISTAQTEQVSADPL